MADKLNINLRYCYGIGKLEAELEFKHKGYAIYAPNGVMKTSLAKTMMDLSEGNSPKDLHFPNREPTCEITLNGEAIKKEEIFVVKSYDDKFSSSQVSTLLANAELRAKYEGIHQSIGEATSPMMIEGRYGVIKNYGRFAWLSCQFRQKTRERNTTMFSLGHNGSDICFARADQLDTIVR